MLRNFILPVCLITVVSGFLPQHHGGPHRHVERYVEWKKKETLSPQGNVAGVVGNLPVSFKVMGTDSVTDTLAFAGEGLSEVAAKADVFIKYKCKKGECGTCEVMLDGKWIRACQTKIPGALPGGEPYTISVRDIPDDKKSTLLTDGFPALESEQA